MLTAKSFVMNLALVALGALAAAGCWRDVDQLGYGNPAFRCAPNDAEDACPDGYTCCSDDPATVGGKLPAYRAGQASDPDFGVALFSDNNNPLGNQGLCTDISQIVNPLNNGCPVPCNPTWEPGQISEVCGGAVCCQTEELDPMKDCVLDPVTSRWRAVSGKDVPGLTQWGNAHATNQDPNATGCQMFAGTADFANATLADCVSQLSVANQRGFCNAVCPCVEDRCELLNPGAAPKCGPAI